MKRTTYIIFGMLLTGLVVVCAGIFYASMQVTGWDNNFLDIKGEKKTVQLPEWLYRWWQLEISSLPARAKRRE